MLGWLMALVMMMLVPVCVASGEEEFSPFLAITADSAFVYAKAKAEDPLCTLRKDQLCGLVAEVNTADGGWYSVVCMDEGRNGCFGYIPKGVARRLTMAEFNALMEDIDRANEVMDLITAINQETTGQGGTGAAADGGGAGEQTNDGNLFFADLGTVQELYENAMQALSSFSSGELTLALEDMKEMQGEAMEQAMSAGSNLVGAAAKGISDRVTDAADRISGELNQRIPELTEKAQTVMENLQESLGALGDAGEMNLSGLGKDFTSTRENGEKALEDAIQTASGKVEELTGEASELLSKVMDTYLPAIGAGAKEIGDAYREKGFFEGARMVLSKVERLLSLLNNDNNN